MPDTAHIIFLHGPSSSGKSTIARALQARIEQPFWHISIDHLRDSGVLPLARFKSGEFDWKGTHRANFFVGFHASLAAYAQAGNNLIVEHILDTSGWLEELADLFRPFDTYFVGIHCDPAELARREAARGDRQAGSALQDFETVHKGRIYDLELRSADGVDVNVEKILAGWRRPERRSDFSD